VAFSPFPPVITELRRGGIYADQKADVTGQGCGLGMHQAGRTRTGWAVKRKFDMVNNLVSLLDG